MKGDQEDATNVSEVKNDVTLDQDVGGGDGKKRDDLRYV